MRHIKATHTNQPSRPTPVTAKRQGPSAPQPHSEPATATHLTNATKGTATKAQLPPPQRGIGESRGAARFGGLAALNPPQGSGRYKWTNGGTVKENMDMLYAVTDKSVEAPTTVMAPMTSFAPPIVSPRAAAASTTTGAPGASSTLLAGSSTTSSTENELPEIQRNKYKFSCQTVDGSLHSKTVDNNRMHAEQLMYKFNASHDRKVAFYKKYRSPNPADDDYDAFADNAKGPFDLQRPVTEIDFQNVTDAELFESHYVEILTLFTDDSFVKQLSVGGEIDKELLRVRSINILKSGGTVLEGGNAAGSSPLLRRKSSLRILMRAAQSVMSAATVSASRNDEEGGNGASSSPQSSRQKKVPDEVAAQAKMALFKLFSEQSRNFGEEASDDASENANV